MTKSQTNTAVIRGLRSGTIYVFQVRARTVAGFGRFSGKMYFQTMTEGEGGLPVIAAITPVAFDLCCVFSLLSVEEYNSSLHEKLPLIIGSAATGLVFIIAVAVLIIVCRR